MIRWSKVGLAIGGVALAIATAFAAETIPPKPAGYFNDYAGVVPKETALQLNEKLAQFERETSNQIVVVVWPDFPSASSLEDFTQRTFQAWNIGQKGKNNGAVLFVFVNDHKMRIQTGYGLEGALPDATCFDIISNVIAPHFKRGDYAGGLAAGTDAMMEAARGEYKGSGKTVAEGRGSRRKQRRRYFVRHHFHHCDDHDLARLAATRAWIQRARPIHRSVYWRMGRWRRRLVWWWKFGWRI